MKQTSKILFTLLVGAGALFTSCDNKTARVVSPDGRNKLSFLVNDAGEIFYSVARDGKPVILKSLLGHEAVEKNMKTGFTIHDVKKESVKETWTQHWGENKTIEDRHNEVAVELKNDEDVSLVFRMRAYDDGIAFRYEWDAGNVDSLTITDEFTEFNFASEGMSWSIPGNFNTYELKTQELPLSKVSDANTPFTFQIDNVFGSIHEAALYDFPEMCIFKSDSLYFKAELAPMPQGYKAKVPGQFSTAWRTFQLGDQAVDLINSSLILNLNEPSKIEDVSWIKPQKYVGVWWGLHIGTHSWTMGPKHGATTENAICHIDFAADNNVCGVLFEGWNQGWENWGGSQHFDYINAYPDFDMDHLAEYSKKKNVSLWMHNETGGNIPEYEASLDSAMQRYAQLGVNAIKTGYAGGVRGGYLKHSQYCVNHYQKVVETAAKYKIMLDVHEPIKDTGIRRTWPNMMTREGARGMEWNAWSEGNSSEYLCTLPFVRLLSGPMDYTPGVFDTDYSRARGINNTEVWNVNNEAHCVKTTLARQIANWVIIYSPLQMASDLIENYNGHPAFQFFRDFNPDCDWSKALAGEVGKYIVVVRRAKDQYFLGAGTNQDKRTIKQSLDFLKPGVSYEAVVYADADNSDVNPENYRIDSKIVTSNDYLDIVMAPNGGQGIVFIPKN